MRIKAILAACLLVVMVWMSSPLAGVDTGSEEGVESTAEEVADVTEEYLDVIAAASLVELYGISAEDARNQMGIKEETRRAGKELMERIPQAVQGGFHIDRLNQGALVVSVTDVEEVPDLRGYEVPIVVREVEYTTFELEQIRDSIDASLSASPELSPIVHVESNTVRLRPFSSDAAAAEVMVEAIQAEHGSAISVGEAMPSRPIPLGHGTA